MSSSPLDVRLTTADLPTNKFPLERILFYVLGAVALIYAFLAGLKTIAEFDLGWQMATGRWIVQHHQIPSTEVFSYTAAGQPWIYPVGSGLIFYATYLLGGYALLSFLAAAACAGTVALLLRRGSAVSAALTILAVPLIASRATPRAEVFTLVLFAATLSLVWQQHETGDASLWLLPVLMIAWVNLHPGFVAGLGLLGAYVMLEILDMLWPSERTAAYDRLRRSWPWLIATCAATLVNPWGWGVYRVLLRQEAAMSAHSQLILEWAPTPVNWIHLKSGLLLRHTGDEFYLLLFILVFALGIALARRQIGAAILIAASVVAPIQHMRFTALFSIVIALVGGAVIASLVRTLPYKMSKTYLRSILAVAATVPLIGLAAVRATNLVTNRTYLSETNLVTFGTGLSWWFPEKAADFVSRENLPGQIFSTGSEGAYMAFRLGPKYKDYIDGRAIPFGTELMLRSIRLKATPPDSPLWKQEIERYDINTILLPIGRFSALQFFPAIKQFCDSDLWRPVYLDEVSIVFLRRRPETEDTIKRLQLNCSTAPLPVTAPEKTGAKAFNQWANAAAVLHALGRDSEAFSAISKALAIFPDSAYLHWTRGHMLQDSGKSQEAEQEYLLATRLEPDLVAPWSALAAYYQSVGRLPEALDAWRTAADTSRWPWDPLQSLGYAYLQAHRPKEALEAFNDAANSLPAHSELVVDNSFLANVAHGRARSWFYLGDLRRATLFEEEAARLIPDNPDIWMQLANLYERQGRFLDAQRAGERASAMNTRHAALSSHP